jgi:hypothetical protein
MCLLPQGRAAILVEVARPNPTAPSATVAAAAQMAIQCGADAIAVRCDSIDTAEASKDLFSVVQVSQAMTACCLLLKSMHRCLSASKRVLEGLLGRAVPVPAPVVAAAAPYRNSCKVHTGQGATSALEEA